MADSLIRNKKPGPCRSELARDSAMSVNNDADCAIVIASKLAPTGVAVAKALTEQHWPRAVRLFFGFRQQSGPDLLQDST
jgi:hypothetical protein